MYCGTHYILIYNKFITRITIEIFSSPKKKRFKIPLPLKKNNKKKPKQLFLYFLSKENLRKRTVETVNQEPMNKCKYS